ncbi:RHS repeat-associated core domain-containing protein [Rothia kristinae]|uniref:RHS repeat-associated core domain-containing protein n=1 Tax=Rothia kristinae TaxID=37923 RepID=UPI0024482E99|nr:RHS repeat-associated core domain-containing protein [Rothia kristinae]WGH09806.1 hypothetical protein OU799_02540 [Rothia kristinae]
MQDAGGIRGNQIADPWTVPTLVAAVEGFFGPVAAAGGASLGAAGGLMVGGLEFMGFRVYDPGVRGLVSVDPLAPVAGSGWSGNPYSFAGNDPVGLVDPWGLSPISPEGLEAYNDAHPSGLLDKVGKWVNDNAGAIAVGVLAVGAVAAVFNPVGFVILGGAVLSGGVDIASQLVSNGFSFRDLDWTSTAKATAIGGIAAPIGGGVGGVLAKTSMSKVGQVATAQAADGFVANSLSYASSAERGKTFGGLVRLFAVEGVGGVGASLAG